MADGQKIFVIGLSKTGTSSLNMALQSLGYRTKGPDKSLLPGVKAGDFSQVIADTETFDGFDDWPYPLVYKAVHEALGTRAKFILTLRRNTDKWMKSIEDHARTRRPLDGEWMTYGFYRPFGREQEYRDYYESHNQAVRDYFKAAGAEDQLLEMCLECGDGWNKLCPFLGFPVRDQPFPHVNASKRFRRPLRRVINSAIEPIYRAYASW